MVYITRKELALDMLSAFKWVINHLHCDPVKSLKYLSQLSFFPLSIDTTLAIHPIVVPTSYLSKMIQDDELVDRIPISSDTATFV